MSCGLCFFMSKASCIFVAYSELQMRKTLKPLKSVSFSLQFWHISHWSPTHKYEPDFLFSIGIPFFGKASRVFAKRLTALVKTKFNVDINVYYTCFKTGSYFQLKCSTPFPLLSNVVCKFSCSRDANISYMVWLREILALGFRNICNTKPLNQQFVITVKYAKTAS